MGYSLSDPLSIAPFQVCAYYKYAIIPDPEAYAASHLQFCNEIGIKGRIYVADEGLNGQLSGTPEAIRQYISHLLEDERFTGTDFKVDDTDFPAFVKCHVRHKAEIVNSGLKELGVNPMVRTGVHLDPEEFRKYKDEEDVVLLDVRSEYETRIGKFKNAITLDIENFRDFPAKLAEIKPQLEGKKIITYCTGGIKCEKASAYLLENGFDDVFQLHGGIVRYAHESKGEDFEGKLFVFDGRVVVDVNEVNPTIISTCIHCAQPSARMVNCSNETCNDRVVICDDCGYLWDGACSTSCKDSPHRRPYNGQGYYQKGRMV